MLFCINASPGATNRRYLQEDQFLAQEAQFPKERDEQDRLCEVLDGLSRVGREGESTADALASDFGSLLRSTLHAVFGGILIDLDASSGDVSALDEALSLEDDETSAVEERVVSRQVVEIHLRHPRFSRDRSE